MASIDPVPYFAASAVSAFTAFPLWKAAAIGQSGFELQSKSPFCRYWEAVRPPWKGSFSVVAGMTWARAAIFCGSDVGAQWFRGHGANEVIATTLPPLFISIVVQLINQPFLRSAIMLQDPGCQMAKGAYFPNIEVVKYLVQVRGLQSLWLGTNVAILKTAPKYVIVVSVKGAFEKQLPPVDPNDKKGKVIQSAKKSIAASFIGAFLTNPFGVLRNEMFRTEESLGLALSRLCRDEGCRWMFRGAAKHSTAVAVPIAGTIFMTDMLATWLHNDGKFCRK